MRQIKASPFYQYHLQTPIHQIVITTTAHHLTGIRLLSDETDIPYGSSKAYPPVMHQATDQLSNYFQNAYFQFTIPIQLCSTPFQHQVFECLQAIPIGQTKTYGDLAKQLKTSSRAIGNACRANPIPLIIPCHRVVSQKNIGGFCGQKSEETLTLKRWLIDHEKKAGYFFGFV